jgi:hypothetical protein
MPPISIPGNVLIDALHSNLYARAAVLEHVREVRLQAVVGARFYGDADALGLALLGVEDGFVD